MTLSLVSSAGNGSKKESSVAEEDSVDEVKPGSRRQSMAEESSKSSMTESDAEDEVSVEHSEESEHSDTESERHSNTLVEDEVHDEGWLEETQTNESQSRSGTPTSDGRESVRGIKDLSPSNKKAHWSKCPSPNIFNRKRNTGSMADKSSTSSNPAPSNQRRPKSALSHRNIPAVSSVDKRANISSFQRSLKLLGFQPEDFGIRKDEGEERQSRSRTRKIVAPTLQTRVVQRSVSLDCLRDVVRHENSTTSLEMLNRETLSKAVYEEWYFKKLHETQAKKKLLLTKEREKQEHLENARVEKIKKVEESLSKWKAIKAKERKNTGKVPKQNAPQLYSEQPVSKEMADKAFEKWKKDKDKILKEEKKLRNEAVQKKLEKEKKDAQERKSDAQKVFDHWKKKADEALKKFEQERKKKTKEQVQKKEAQKNASRKPGTPFEDWKILKDNELKVAAKIKAVKKAEAERVQSARHADRRYEVEQVFEEWLDRVEEREQQRLGAEKKRRGSLPPPWSPL